MFIRNVFFTLSTELLTVGGNFLVGILLARGLSVPERGVMALVMALPWTVASLANLGLPYANIYMIGRKKLPAKAILGTSLILAVLLGLLAVGSMLALRSTLLSTALKGLPSEYYPLLLVLIPLLLVDGVLLSIMRARQRFDLYNLRRLAASLLLLAGFSGILLFFRAGLQAVVWVYVGVTILLVVISIILTRRDVPISMEFDRQVVGPSFRFGMKSYLQNFAGALNYRLDIYLLAFFMAPEQVAYYAIATAVAEVAWLAPNTIGLVLTPRLSNAPLEEVHAITARVCRNTLFLTLGVVVLLGAVSWFLIPVFYGVAYSASVIPLLVLLPGIVFMAVYKVLTRNYTSRDRQQVTIVAAFTGLLINVGLNLVFIPIWGVVGAAFASTISYTVAGLLLLGFFLRESRLSWQEALLPKRNELQGHYKWARMVLLNQWGRAKV
jgi:O-antigen/teichoic acid export membrane protein